MFSQHMWGVGYDVTVAIHMFAIAGLRKVNTGYKNNTYRLSALHLNTNS